MREMQGQPLTGRLRNVPHHSTGRKQAFRLASAVALLAGTMAPAAQKQPNELPSAPAQPKHTIARKLTVPGIPRFGEVPPTLYRGAQPTQEGFSNLAQMGINIVVDLRGSRQSERRLVTRLGMRYVPLHWQCFSPRDEDFAKFLTLLRENPGKKVFVHCRVGDDRTGMDIAAYRIAEQGWTAQEARKEMEAYGVNWFHKLTCLRLLSYEKEFPQRFKTSTAFQNLRSGKTAPESQP
jgi:tyrosine-protein phosphatase SIW14